MDNRSDGWCNGYVQAGSIDIREFHRDDAEKVNYDMPTNTDMDSFAQSLFLSYKFHAMTLSSTTIHRNQDIEGNYDADSLAGTFLDWLRRFNYTENDTYSQEIRFSGNNTSGIRWVGGFYFDTENNKMGPCGQEMVYPP